MRVWLPASPASDAVPAIVVFRGGAYNSSSGSGAGSAEWVATKGMVGIEAAYGARNTNTFYPANYADGARAIRLVRSRAREWGIDEHRVAVLGYSAGGHLASLVSTQPSVYLDPRDDLAPVVSARPDLVVLGYPVISFVDGYYPARSSVRSTTSSARTTRARRCVGSSRTSCTSNRATRRSSSGRRRTTP